MSINDAVKDPEVLEMLYWHEGLSMFQIAERLGVSETTVYRYMNKYGVDRRGRGVSSRGYKYKKSVNYRSDNRGYPCWRGSKDTDGFSTIPVHQLLAISEGADPAKVFSGGKWHVHHKNGVKWDNRPENIDFMTNSEHMKHHAKERDWEELGSWTEYDDEEMLDWIRNYVQEFGHVPTSAMVDGWPGPSPQSYANRFGSWSEAVNLAGWKIPNHTTDSRGRVVKYEEPEPVDSTGDDE